MRWEKRPVNINVKTCNGIKFIRNTYPPQEETYKIKCVQKLKI